VSEKKGRLLRRLHPSSKLPVNGNKSGREQAKKGGAKIGHPGHGRKSHEADTVILSRRTSVCPECGGELVVIEDAGSAVIESTATTPERLLYKIPTHGARTAKSSSGTNPQEYFKEPSTATGLAQLAVMHYYHGIPIGGSPRIDRR